MPVEDRAREPDPVRGVGRLDESFRGGVVMQSQADEVERVGGDDLEAVVGGDPGGELCGQLDVAADQRLERLDRRRGAGRTTA